MTEAKPLRVLVVDDEPLAVERLQVLLARFADVTLVGTASDGDGALRMVEGVAPDLLLLDIAMPGMDGMDVARALARLEKSPLIVFVTAFDAFAVGAFDLEAVDYLMKPVTPDRLARALERTRDRMDGAPRAKASGRQPRYIEEFWVPEQSGLVRLAARDIDRISAERDYMRLHAGQRSWLINHTIAKLEEELDPAHFVRLHRSAIVRRDFVIGFRRDESGRWYARFPNGEEQKIGRLYLHNAKELAGRK